MPGFNVAQRARGSQDAEPAPTGIRNVRAKEFPSAYEESPEARCASGELPFTACQLVLPDWCYWTIWSRRFGEPVPGLVTLPVTAPAVRAEATWAGVAEVWPAR